MNVVMQGMKGNEIIELIDAEGRLEKPPHCPPLLYHVMLHCWKRL